MPTNISSQLPFFLTLNATYEQAFQRTEPWAAKVATIMPCDGEVVLNAWMEDLPDSREWLGPKVIHSPILRDSVSIIKNFEYTVGVNKFHVADDKLGVYLPRTNIMAKRAAKLKDKELLALFSGSKLAWDKVPFWGTHAVNIDDASMGTYSNVDTATSVVEAINKAFTAMGTRKGASGNLLAVSPKKVFYGHQLHEAVFQALRGQTTSHRAAGTTADDAATVVNPWFGLIEPIMIEEMSALPGVMIFSDDSNGVSPFVFHNRQEPEMTQMLSASDPSVFYDALYVYGWEARGVADYSLPFLAHKVTVA